MGSRSSIQDNGGDSSWQGGGGAEFGGAGLGGFGTGGGIARGFRTATLVQGGDGVDGG